MTVRIVYGDPHFAPRDSQGNATGEGFRYAVYEDANAALQQAVNDLDQGGNPLRIESKNGETLVHSRSDIDKALKNVIRTDKQAERVSEMYLSRQERDGKSVLPE